MPSFPVDPAVLSRRPGRAGSCWWRPGRRRLLVALPQPVEGGLGDVAPAIVDSERVPPVGELAEISDSGRLVVELPVAVVIATGTVWSWPPAISSSGPRSLLRVSTAAGELRVKLARASSNKGLPGEGMVQWSNSSAECCALSWSRNRSGTGSRSAPRPFPGRQAGARRSRPPAAPAAAGIPYALDGRRVNGHAPAARFCPSSLCTIRPPKECPITMGGALNPRMIPA